MRSILLLVFLVTVPSYGHPLDNAIKALSKARIELANVEVQNATDPWMKTQISSVSYKLATLWSESMLIPIHKNELQMKRLGFSFAKNPDPLNPTKFVENENAASLASDAYRLRADRWRELGQLIQEQLSELKEADLMMQSRDYTDGFTYTEKQTVEHIVHSNRSRDLFSAQNMVANKINCIDFFADVANRYGLKMVLDDQHVEWSSEDLQRVHGSPNISLMNKKEKEKIGQEIDDVIEKSVNLDLSCLTPEMNNFLIQVQRQLSEVSK